MFGKITSIFTTAKPIGVAVRDITIALGSILAVLGVLGVLTPQQVQDLTHQVDVISGQVPALLLAVGAMMTAGMSIYRIIFRSTSDKAAEAAKLIDATVPANATVEIRTPNGTPNIIVPGK